MVEVPVLHEVTHKDPADHLDLYNESVRNVGQHYFEAFEIGREKVTAVAFRIGAARDNYEMEGACYSDGNPYCLTKRKDAVAFVSCSYLAEAEYSVLSARNVSMTSSEGED